MRKGIPYLRGIGLLGVVMFIVLIMLAGCTTGAEKKVATDGSTSMEKVIGALGEAFENENSGITFTYNPTGSGTGITAVLDGLCDIGLSSRALKDEEIAKGLVGTTLAYDGIAVIVNTENIVSDLTLEQIAKIYTGEITNWKDVGGKDAEIVLIGREANSGTREGFESITGTKNKCQYRQELTATGDVISAVSGNPNAIGYASVASVKDTVRIAAVNGVIPSDETIKDGSYQIQRSFVLVTKEGIPFLKLLRLSSISVCPRGQRPLLPRPVSYLQTNHLRSFRASAHTGVGIPRLNGITERLGGLPHQPSGWFAMTAFVRLE